MNKKGLDAQVSPTLELSWRTVDTDEAIAEEDMVGSVDLLGVAWPHLDPVAGLVGVEDGVKVEDDEA